MLPLERCGTLPSTSGPIVVVPIPKGIPPWGTEAENLLGHVGSTSQDPDRGLTQSAAAAVPAGVLAEPRFRGGAETSGQARQADSGWEGFWQ